eukprot:TRINITY_DN23539_c0_g1_i1.p1 TRINITY_DN23539_c0_g1~~TRINITY_DN23539_c0_g1_i1.p1  ORF type:complete len:257 (+),score=26.35 TRINITY_DN23539_c0_g1_i1:123-893(+)
MSFLSAGSSSSSSWRDASGRQCGGEGYHFGDLTRSVWKSFSSSTDWKAFSGRRDGSNEYQFGDISRAFTKGIAGTIRVKGAPCPSGSMRRIDSEKMFELSDIWQTFFQQCVVCGLSALQKDLLAKEDVIAQEPYLFIGLPGLCLLECVLRSISLRAPSDSVLFADGRLLRRETIPNEEGAPQLFSALLALRERMSQASLTDERCDRLRHLVVHAEGDANGDAALTQLGSLLQGLSTDISQLPFFRAHFLEVLDKLT